MGLIARAGKEGLRFRLALSAFRLRFRLRSPCAALLLRCRLLGVVRILRRPLGTKPLVAPGLRARKGTLYNARAGGCSRRRSRRRNR